ncbi:hypothetical protein KEU06_09230 [Pseudaminobacter sp. 19-2017]|uniref:Uncharacterized protein n=1 Tax=Pseudaminobacter soli (ex Zhang et al. 2022) TaxID=2831468 RepID=A0A942I903_9HYPH|nr:hypothetical protein [Pseudaminobacter soli]MBS3648786.1 hypothetical protein [Pseudaminobacter soli]
MAGDQNYERYLEGRQLRRMKADDRWLARRERLEAKADRMIGELCRDGKTVHYVFPVGGRYKEGTWGELVDYLIRNKWVH